MHNSTSIIVLLDAGLCVCKTGVAPIPGVVAGRSSLPRAMFVLFLSVCFGRGGVPLVRGGRDLLHAGIGPLKHGAAFWRCALYVHQCMSMRYHLQSLCVWALCDNLSLCSSERLR